MRWAKFFFDFLNEMYELSIFQAVNKLNDQASPILQILRYESKQESTKVEKFNLVDLTNDLNISFKIFYAVLILNMNKTYTMACTRSRKRNPGNHVCLLGC